MIAPWQNILSAFFASSASVFGKFAFDLNEGSFASQTVHSLAALTGLDTSLTTMIVRAVFIIGLIIANSCMLKFYVESMRSYTALQATMFNFAFNFLFSALSGMLIFGEILTLRWWLGASIMLSGVLLTSGGMSKNEVAKEKKNK